MRCRQSARLIPAAAMRISTSPAFGSGTGRVPGTSTSGPPGVLISITVCVGGMFASTIAPLVSGGPSYYHRRQPREEAMPVLQDKIALVTGAGAGIGNAIAARTVAECGRLDVIVNNAGVTRYADIMELTEADWDRIHRVNAKGVFFCLQAAARQMIA